MAPESRSTNASPLGTINRATTSRQPLESGETAISPQVVAILTAEIERSISPGEKPIHTSVSTEASSGGRPHETRLANLMPHIALVIALADREGVLLRLPALLNGCSTTAEVREIIGFLETFFRLPDGDRPALLNELREAIVSRLGGEGRETQEAVARFFEQVFGEIGREAVRTYVENTKVPMSEAIPVTTTTVVNDNGRTLFLGSIPLTQMFESLPRGTPQEVAQTKEMEFTLRRIASVPLDRPSLPKTQRYEMRQPVEILIQRFLANLFSLKGPALPRAIAPLLRTWNHRTSAIRLLVVNLLRELSMRETRKVFDNLYLNPLKALCRQSESPDVQAEAIQVLLDMGSQQGRSHEDMEALFKSIDLTRHLMRLLHSKDPELFRKGLGILKSMGRWFPEVLQGHLRQVLKRAKTGLPESIREEALGVLLRYQRYLDIREKTSLMQPGMYPSLRVATWRAYAGGGSNYVGRLAA